MSNTQRPRDPMTTFRTVKRSKNSKGGDRIELYLGGHQTAGNEQLDKLIEVLTAHRDNPKGVKLDLHITKKESQDGRAFDSCICFVKPVSVGPQGNGTATFTPRAAAQADTATAKAKIEKARQQFTS